MISAQFRIQLPNSVWVADLSTSFPQARFRLLSGYRLGDRALELGEISAKDPHRIVEAMRTHPGIESYELLESDDQRALGKYETTDTALYEFVESSTLTIEFPVTVRNGWYEFDLTGTRNELDKLEAVLDASPFEYDLVSLLTADDPDRLVTDRQRELLRVAARMGYFEVPRGCTLSELAEEVGVDKSTASTILRRAQGTLVEWFLSRPGTVGSDF